MSDRQQSIWIFGAGAVGSGIGAFLARAGHEVVLIGRDPHMAAVRERGLRLTGIWGEHHVRERLHPVTTPPTAPAPDLVFLTVKSYDTRTAAETLAEVIRPDTAVISIQNGVGNVAVLQDVLGPERVLAGMVIIGFEMPEPGHVRVTVEADVIRIGRTGDRPDGTVERVVRVMREAGLPVAAEPEIEAVQWGKVLYNSALNPLGAILRCHYGVLLAPEPWAIIERVIAEAFRVFDAGEIHVRWQTADEYLAHLRDVQIPVTFDHRPSMLTDVSMRGRTEIDVINGAITTRGAALGVPTPVNDTLCTLIRALCRPEFRPGSA